MHVTCTSCKLDQDTLITQAMEAFIVAIEPKYFGIFADFEVF